MFFLILLELWHGRCAGAIKKRDAEAIRSRNAAVMCDRRRNEKRPRQRAFLRGQRHLAAGAAP